MKKAAVLGDLDKVPFELGLLEDEEEERRRKLRALVVPERAEKRTWRSIPFPLGGLFICWWRGGTSNGLCSCSALLGSEGDGVTGLLRSSSSFFRSELRRREEEEEGGGSEGNEALSEERRRVSELTWLGIRLDAGQGLAREG